MMFSDLLRLSLDNLRRRKGRTLLTVIGVVVGTCAIVVMISLGLAANLQNEQMLQNYGDLTQIQIYNYSGASTAAGTPKLDDAMLDTIRAAEHVVAVTPYYQSSTMNATLYAGHNDRYSCEMWNTYGLYPDAVEALGITLQSGQYLTESMSVGNNKIPILIGQNAAYQFVDTKKSENSNDRQVYEGQLDAQGNPVPPFVDMSAEKLTLRLKTYDDTPKTQDYQLVVVGVMTTDQAKGYFTESGIVMRLSDMQKLEQAYRKLSGTHEEKNTTGYEQVYVKVDDVDNVNDVEQWLKDMGYDTYSMTQIREEMQASVAKSQMILGGLAAVSLLVAALNIANTMTMAIYERTREIGVMKVLGCGLNKIRAMFLMEAGTIGFMGGVIGVVFSCLISFVMNHLGIILAAMGGSGDISGLLSGFGSYGYDGSAGSSLSIIPLWLILLALGFATLVGVLSGLLPANRAMKISALEAIRHE